MKNSISFLSQHYTANTCKKHNVIKAQIYSGKEHIDASGTHGVSSSSAKEQGNKRLSNIDLNLSFI